MVEQGMKQGSLSVLENSTFRNWIFNSLLAVTAANATNNNNNNNNNNNSGNNNNGQAERRG